MNVIIFLLLGFQITYGFSNFDADEEPRSRAVLGIGVLSASGNRWKRDVARQTWMKFSQISAGLVDAKFFIATPADQHALQTLLQEQKEFNDIIISAETESYHKTTYQLIEMASYYGYTYPVDIIFKNDDDNFVRVDRVLDWAQRELDRPKESRNRHAIGSRAGLFYGGNLVQGATVHRVGKYNVPVEEYPDETYPLFARGPGYVYSGELARLFTRFHKEKGLRIFRLEDVSIALWVDDLIKNHQLTIDYVREHGFNSIRVCDERAFTVLLEEGRPLERNVTQTNYEIWENIQKGYENVCPIGTTLVDCMLKGRIRSVDQKRQAFKQNPTEQNQQEYQQEKDELKSVEQQWKDYWKLFPSSSSGTSSSSNNNKPVHVLLYDDVKSNQFHMHAEGSVQCSVPCIYTSDHKKIGEVDVVVFNGDNEFYVPHPDRELPVKPNSHVKYALVFREAIPKLQSHKWKRYDINITYHEKDVIYPYAIDTNGLLAQAKDSYRFVKPPTKFTRQVGDVPPSVLGHTAFVSLRCGNPNDPNDGRGLRVQLVQDLMKHTQVDSYGVCLRNTPWPAGHDRDKHYVMLTHKFCLGIENTIDPYYHTEKLFDCYRAASVPVYLGDRSSIDKFVPNLPNQPSIIYIDDYKDMSELAKKLDELASNEEEYEKYRAWIKEPPQEWLQYMKKVDAIYTPCRLCEYMRAQVKPKNPKLAQIDSPTVPSKWKPRFLYDKDIDNMHWEYAERWYSRN